ncbi:MAG: hypothetical protein ACFFG0_07515 [Candidatus Thorarchaeota archaeon]
MIKKIFNKVKSYEPIEEFSPFKVVFEMNSPISLSHPWIHLDGIIAHLLLRNILGNLFYILPTNLPLDFFSILKLPIKQTKIDKHILYHSSISFFNIEKIYVKHIFKKFHERDLQIFKNKRIKRIYISSGKFKNYKIQIPYIPSTKVIFYGNGNISEIEYLLRGLSGLGKKISIGYGFIKDFKIREIESDISIINKDNISMKPIPIEFLKGNKDKVEKMFLGYKFPYWSKTNITLCAIPGEKVWIKHG